MGFLSEINVKNKKEMLVDFVNIFLLVFSSNLSLVVEKLVMQQSEMEQLKADYCVFTGIFHF